jgi:hypothetical protein
MNGEVVMSLRYFKRRRLNLYVGWKGEEGRERERKREEGRGEEGRGRKRKGEEGRGKERKGEKGRGKERKGGEGRGRERKGGRKGKEGRGKKVLTSDQEPFPGPQSEEFWNALDLIKYTRASLYLPFLRSLWAFKEKKNRFVNPGDVVCRRGKEGRRMNTGGRARSGTTEEWK